MSLSRAIVPPGHPIDPPSASRLLANWGFLAEPDLPDRPGPAWLLVAIRPVPTLRHFDPELVEYWVSEKGRGRRDDHVRDADAAEPPVLVGTHPGRGSAQGVERVPDVRRQPRRRHRGGRGRRSLHVARAPPPARRSLPRVGPARGMAGRSSVACSWRSTTNPASRRLSPPQSPSLATPHSSATARPVTGRASSGAWTRHVGTRRPRNVGSGASILKRGWRVTSCWPRAAWLHDLWPVQSGHPTLSPLRSRALG